MAPILIDKEEKKKKILKAAMVVFADKGYHNARMIDVAEYADIGKGTIYEYFKSKKDLFIKLYQSMMEEQLIYITQSKSAHIKPAKKLENLITSTLQAYQQMENFYYIMLDFRVENRSNSEDAFEISQFARLYKDYRKEMGAIIEEGIKDKTFRKVDTDYVASIIMGITEGLMFQWICDRRAFTLKKIGSVITNMILAYLKRVKQTQSIK